MLAARSVGQVWRTIEQKVGLEILRCLREETLEHEGGLRVTLICERPVRKGKWYRDIGVRR